MGTMQFPKGHHKGAHMSDTTKLVSLFASIVALGSTPILLSAGMEWYLANKWWFYCQSNGAEAICQALF